MALTVGRLALIIASVLLCVLPREGTAQVVPQVPLCCLEELNSEGYITESALEYSVTLVNSQPLAAYATALGEAHCGLISCPLPLDDCYGIELELPELTGPSVVSEFQNLLEWPFYLAGTASAHASGSLLMPIRWPEDPYPWAQAVVMFHNVGLDSGRFYQYFRTNVGHQTATWRHTATASAGASWYDGVEIGNGSGGLAVSGLFEPIEPKEPSRVRVEVTAQMSGKTHRYKSPASDPCYTPDDGSCLAPTIVTSVSFVSFHLKGINGTTVVSQATSHGLFGVLGAVVPPVRLGFMANANHTYDPGEDIDVYDGEDSVEITDEDEAMGFELTSFADTFRSFDGDINRDNAICSSDRGAFGQAFGSSIGNVNYNPRADFDLNGEIDEDDRDAFFVVYAATRCIADFNCDDALDPDDLGDFTNCYYAEVGTTGSCPSADFNADGVIDTDDLGDFINAYFAGC